MRLFLALPLPDPIKRHLVGLGRHSFARWRTDEGDLRLNLVREENLHVTLKFLGEVREDVVQPLSTALRSSPPLGPIALQIGGIEFFPERGPIRVVAAGLEGDVGRLNLLHRHVEEIGESFGFPRERRAYLPHITLGRSRNRSPAMLPGAHLRESAGRAADTSSPSMVGPSFFATDYVLMESRLHPTAPEYRVLASFPLSPAAPTTPAVS